MTMRQLAPAALSRDAVAMSRYVAVFLLILLLPVSAPAESMAPEATTRPAARAGELPPARWMHVEGGGLWSRAALAALKAHGRALTDMVPADIADWCPGYPDRPAAERRAFWVGFLSALAKHESTYRPHAVGGGGRWFGLLQIKPATARGYGCRVGSGAALRDGPANLSCAIRIMARTVPRDGVVSRGMRGVAADWGPLHSQAKRTDMIRWLRGQRYCKLASSPRPRSRPGDLTPITRPRGRPAALIPVVAARD
jgi:hypothetical protein